MFDLLDSYINCKTNTDFAYLLNGDWGCGKSFFIEHNKKFKGIIGKSEKKLVSVSVNGKPDAESAIRHIKNSIIICSGENEKIFSQLKSNSKKIGGFLLEKIKEMPHGGKILSAIEIGGAVADLFYSDAEEKLIKSLADKIVLVVDDLERFSETADITAFLGLLNSEIVSKGFKTILIADESKIVDKCDSEKEKYSIAKEKYIRRTVEFEMPKKETFKDVLTLESDGKNKYTFVTDNRLDVLLEIIDGAFSCEQRPNVRTILFACDLMEELFTIIDEPLSDFVSNRIFYNLIIYAKLYKAALIDKNTVMHTSYIKPNKAGKDEELYCQLKNNMHYHRIQGCDLDIHSEWIKTFVCVGKLDKERISLWIRASDKRQYNVEFNELNEYPFMDNEKVKEIARNINEKLDNFAYDAEDLALEETLVEKIKKCLINNRFVNNGYEFEEKVYSSITFEENLESLFSYFGVFSEYETEHLFFKLYPEIKEKIQDFIKNNSPMRNSMAERFYIDIKTCNERNLNGYSDLNMEILPLVQKYDGFKSLMTFSDAELKGLFYYLSYCVPKHNRSNSFSNALSELKNRIIAELNRLNSDKDVQRIDVFNELLSVL